MAKLISKTKYMLGLQCPKLLWYYFNAAEEIPEMDEDTKATIEQGKLVGEYAKKLYPQGVNVPTKTFMGRINNSKELVQKRVPLFEPGFMVEDCYAQADILLPVEENEWDIIEVKSATQVKDEYYDDVAFQKYVYEKAGLKIRNCFVLHINNQYMKIGELDLKELFIEEDITEQVVARQVDIPSNLIEFRKIIYTKQKPEQKIGQYCDKPYRCILYEKCWAFLPEKNVFSLYYGKKKAYELFADNILKIKEIPADHKLSDKQKIQVEAINKNEPVINKKSIKSFLEEITYPAYYLDFETFNTAIPMFDYSRPYEHISFQFSLHVVEKAKAEPKHYSFLAKGNKDPRPEFIEQLKSVLGNKGSIIAFNAGFEKKAIEVCVQAAADYQSWAEVVFARIVDLILPFRNFDYYHPAQNGSASLKKVLPALVGKSYDNMDIGDGMTASREYFRVTYTPENKDKEKILKALEEYCSLDTLGMVDIVNKLYDLVY
ncbi:MAG: DUF2779 domain-containing protein [Candidatus Margulisbacteria bacterium]|nr:DUF2779 domain-containing protein [Candidatus Margulisiibacteriota bacterium]